MSWDTAIAVIVYGFAALTMGLWLAAIFSRPKKGEE